MYVGSHEHDRSVHHHHLVVRARQFIPRPFGMAQTYPPYGGSPCAHDKSERVCRGNTRNMAHHYLTAAARVIFRSHRSHSHRSCNSDTAHYDEHS